MTLPVLQLLSVIFRNKDLNKRCFTRLRLYTKSKILNLFYMLYIVYDLLLFMYDYKCTTFNSCEQSRRK